MRRRAPDLFEGRDPLAVRQVQIEQDGGDPVAAQPLEPVDEPLGAFDDERAVVRVGQRFPDRADRGGVVANEQYPHGLEGHRHGRILYSFGSGA